MVEDIRVTPRVKHIDISVYFLQELFDNGIFVPKYENYSVMPESMCTKSCLGLIILRSNKCMAGFSFYPYSYTEHHQIMKLHGFDVV